jgi:hypothetical protein
VVPIATSRRTPFGSITTSLGARGIVVGFLEVEALLRKLRPGASLLAPHMVGKVGSEVNRGHPNSTCFP